MRGGNFFTKDVSSTHVVMAFLIKRSSFSSHIAQIKKDLSDAMAADLEKTIDQAWIKAESKIRST
ncbi:MAG: hypothetical protein PHO09_09185 [Sphaerochaeta sp.]|nr:hypothetical protein [Sphaerochaeta sp.]